MFLLPYQHSVRESSPEGKRVSLRWVGQFRDTADSSKQNICATKAVFIIYISQGERRPLSHTTDYNGKSICVH